MGKVSVIVVDATGNKEQRVGLPDDIKIGIIMVKLVEKIKLPSTGPDGNPISYKFIHKVTGRQLLETQTLSDAGIKDGDVLRLQPEITAGAVCPKCLNELSDNAAFCTNCGTAITPAPQANPQMPQQDMNLYQQNNMYSMPQAGYSQKNFLDNLLNNGKSLSMYIGMGCAAVTAIASIILALPDVGGSVWSLMSVLNGVARAGFMFALALYMGSKKDE